MDGEGTMIKYHENSVKQLETNKNNNNEDIVKYVDGKPYHQRWENGILVSNKSQHSEQNEEDKEIIEEEHDIVPEDLDLKDHSYRYDPESRILKRSSYSVPKNIKQKTSKDKHSQPKHTRSRFGDKSMGDSITVLHKSQAKSEIINIADTRNFEGIAKLPSIIFKNPYVSKWTVKDV